MFALLLLVATFDGPEVTQAGTCADADLAERLARLLETSNASGEGWRVEATAREEGDAQEMEVTIGSPEGSTSTRTLTSADCNTAVDAAAFIVATAIDPSLEADPQPPSNPALIPKPEPEAPSPSDVRAEVEPAPTPVALPPRPSDSARDFEVWLGLGAGVMGGALPGPVGRLSVLATVERERWRARLDGAASLRSDVRATQAREVGAHMGHWALGGRGCALHSWTRLGVSGCAGVEFGRVYAEGFGFQGATSTRIFWGAGLGSLGFEVVLLERLRAWVDGEVGGLFDRASVVVDHLGPLHRLGPVFGRGAVGLAVCI